MDGSPAHGGERTGALVAAAAARLATNGEGTARLDAELLLAHVLDVGRTTILAHPDAPVGPAQAAAYRALVERRAAGEPLAYLRGTKEFHGLALASDARALVPRPETELLVDLAVADLMDRLTAAARPAGTPPLRAWDVGTGSGAIAVALAAALRDRRALGEVVIRMSDRSPDALALALENAVAHGVADAIEPALGDLFATDPAPAPPYLLVLANLPYIPTGDIDGLPLATRFEPVLALDGGPDGLDLVRRLMDGLPAILGPGGLALLEIGADQGPATLAEAAARLPAWTAVLHADLAGRTRVAALRAPVPG